MAKGTDAQKIIFTSSAASPQPGDWRSISFVSTATDDSIIENAIIEYGGGVGRANLMIQNSNPTIRHCTIRHGSSAGIRLYGNRTSQISCCDITENKVGIEILSTSGTTKVTNNNIFGNLSYGIYNQISWFTLDAINNWWGDASGPGGVGPGSGDAVSHGVDYDPWLVEPSACCKPDLVVSSLVAPEKVRLGKTIVVKVMTKNNGSASAGASTTGIYLSTDKKLGKGDTWLESISVPDLAAGELYPGEKSVTVPSGIGAGTYYIFAVADDDGIISEIKETNNVRKRPITIQ